MRHCFFSRSPLRLGGIVLAAVLLACQQKSAREELLKKMDPIGSWLAALQMTGEKWAANSVPTSFVRTTSGAARKAFEKAAKETDKSPASSELRAALRALIGEAGAAAVGLERAARTPDRAAAARQVARLAALHARFEKLSKGG